MQKDHSNVQQSKKHALHAFEMRRSGCVGGSGIGRIRNALDFIMEK